MGEATTRLYRKGILEAEGFPVGDVSQRLEEPDTVVWVDFCVPSRSQLAELDADLGLHELAMEDALGPHQRPRLARYANHLFLTCQAVQLDVGEANLQETEIDAFINERWLITVRKGDGFSIDAVLERCDRSPDLSAHGVSFFLYSLLDVLVDGYFDAVQAFDDYYDDISEGIFADNPLDLAEQRQWFDMRRAMVRLHRLAVPLREAVGGLVHRNHATVTHDLDPYYQDVYDKVLRVGEASDTLRELVSSIVETNINLRDYHQNQVVKKVTSWAAIIAVPTLVTGYYGMNVPYPGSGTPGGAVASAALIIALSGCLYLLFRWRDWL